jgi:hypothetical protein
MPNKHLVVDSISGRSCMGGTTAVTRIMQGCRTLNCQLSCSMQSQH